MIKVIAFGSFDPLHPGHIDFLQQAKAFGSHLTVIVARDNAIRTQKKHEPSETEDTRIKKIAALPLVNLAMLGDDLPHTYELLKQLEFDIVVVGYDQHPANKDIRAQLDAFGKQRVKIVRLKPFRPDKYKSSYFRQ